MQTKPEFRRSERLGHAYIIKLGEDLTLSPYYAVAHNLSETGMYFKSLFELHPGAHIRIIIDDYALGRNQVPARVVWCKKLENTATFRYGVGVEFLQSETGPGVKASLPVVPPMKTPGKKAGGVVNKPSPPQAAGYLLKGFYRFNRSKLRGIRPVEIKMEKRSPK